MIRGKMEGGTGEIERWPEMDRRSESARGSLLDRLGGLHRAVKRDHPSVGRMAVAVHDEDNHRLRTFIHSTVGPNPLGLYEVRRETVPSLTDLATRGGPRVLEDLRALPRPWGEHTRKLVDSGFRSSLTVPLTGTGDVRGFLFFDSTEPGYFNPGVVDSLTLAVEAVSLLVLHHLSTVHMLHSAVQMMRELARVRDWETGNHVRRMARYARLVAATLGTAYGFDDETVEFLYLFAPLHDVGKVAVPDRVLLKEGPLDAGELRTMRSHTRIGTAIVDTLLEDGTLGELPHAEMLHNIVRHHHEAVDGSGYPDGLRGEEIPLEARVTTVADVFDALTTRRPYKEAWSVDEAFRFLEGRAGSLFDPDCVEALAASRDEVEEAMARFEDEEVLPVSEEI